MCEKGVADMSQANFLIQPGLDGVEPVVRFTCQVDGQTVSCNMTPYHAEGLSQALSFSAMQAQHDHVFLKFIEACPQLVPACLKSRSALDFREEMLKQYGLAKQASRDELMANQASSQKGRQAVKGS